MKIAVCDDEKLFVDRICAEIDDFYKSMDVLCCRFFSGTELLTAFRNAEDFDLVFLDIEMDGIDGMSTAKKIREFSADVPIIFLTSHTELALEGYEVNAFRFLQKPLVRQKLYAALTDIQNLYHRRNTVVIKESGSEYMLSPDEIISVQSDNNEVRFCTAKREYRSRMKIADAYEMLSKDYPYFFRIHRCVIVNLAHVSGYNDKEAKTDDGEVFPVSRRLSESFKEAIRDYIKKHSV